MALSPRIMALDVGDKTIGIAISDPLNISAQPITTLRMSGENEWPKMFRELENYVNEKNIGTLVCGLPLNMNGSEGPQAEKTRLFIERWEKFRNKNLIHPPLLHFVFWDERLSTKTAENALIHAGVSRGKRKQVIDTMAAVVILQGYLSSLVLYEDED